MSFSVLVVEDEPILRLNLTWHLEEEGLDIREAGDAAEAIKVLELHPEVRLIFTDIDMPESMDGLKLSAYVRDRWPPVRMIITSGKRMVEVTCPTARCFFQAI